LTVGYVYYPEALVAFTQFSWWKSIREERPVSLRLWGHARYEELRWR
jgi:hypothetical protein